MFFWLLSIPNSVSKFPNFQGSFFCLVSVILKPFIFKLSFSKKESFSAWVLRFRAYDTRCLHFCGSQTGTIVGHCFEDFTWFFRAIGQIYLQSFSQCFISFKACATRCWYFFNIKLEQLQIKVLKNGMTLVKLSYF